ncbi:hypothetical protein ISN44_As12g029760 [Arabidopsis suecica]|uniref:Uncharacterized protein n=1 Tax=Arabidopsis suecica TaxID=45249 RepID=A0A8T1YP28_ARASU|nr:hypothetical protein ISN44_As12g029760 [Arabidopsis suecica]
MSLVVHDLEVIGDVDPEGEDRDQFHIEEMLNEWTDKPMFCHDVYRESDGEENDDGPGRFHTHIRRGDGHLYHKQTFFSGVAFKEAVVDDAVRTGCNLKQYMYDQDKIDFKCVGNDGKEEGVRLFVDKIKDNPKFYMPSKIEELIKEQWKINVTRNQCQATRKKAGQWIEKEYDDQFARLRDYAAEILDANPDSHVEIDCLANDEGLLLALMAVF